MLLISDIAKKTNTTIDAIRFYEKKGLLKPTYKGKNGYRYYNYQSLDRLRFINNCRHLDLSIIEIKTLIDEINKPNEKCDNVILLIENHINKLDSRVNELIAFKKNLLDIRQTCNATNLICECLIIKKLCD